MSRFVKILMAVAIVLMLMYLALAFIEYDFFFSLGNFSGGFRGVLIVVFLILFYYVSIFIDDMFDW